jgi:hypothetical protein
MRMKMIVVVTISTLSFVYRALYTVLFNPLVDRVKNFRDNQTATYLIVKGLYFFLGEILPLLVIFVFHYQNISQDQGQENE